MMSNTTISFPNQTQFPGYTLKQVQFHMVEATQSERPRSMGSVTKEVLPDPSHKGQPAGHRCPEFGHLGAAVLTSSHQSKHQPLSATQGLH